MRTSQVLFSPTPEFPLYMSFISLTRSEQVNSSKSFHRRPAEKNNNGRYSMKNEKNGTKRMEFQRKKNKGDLIYHKIMFSRHKYSSYKEKRRKKSCFIIPSSLPNMTKKIYQLLHQFVTRILNRDIFPS